PPPPAPTAPPPPPPPPPYPTLFRSPDNAPPPFHAQRDSRLRRLPRYAPGERHAEQAPPLLGTHLGSALVLPQERAPRRPAGGGRSEEHTSELQSRGHLVCRLLLEKK